MEDKMDGEGEFVSAEEFEAAVDVAEESEASIWGQKSDIDFLGPATSVGEYNEMLSEGDVDAACEDIDDLQLE